MTPAETAAFLRQFNEWRRGDEDIPQPDPRVIGEASDAAVEMIDRLEAAEKDIAMKEEVIDSLAAVVKRLDAQCDAAEKERDVLNAKVERMEQRLRLILEEPENTMSNSKAMREMLKQARLALEGSK